jgi:hypothetical protein
MQFLHKAFVEHDRVLWLVVIWMLTVPLYVGLQAWFGIAWKGRWRVVALVPLIGLVLAMILVSVGAMIIPDAPPTDLNAMLAVPLAGIALFAPLGLLYEIVAGIVWLSRRRPAAD